MQASFHIYCGRSTERLGQNHHTLGQEMENPELHSLEFWVTDCKHKRLDFANFKQGMLTSPLQKKKNPHKPHRNKNHNLAGNKSPG